MQLINAMILLASTAAAVALPSASEGTLVPRYVPTCYITHFTAEHIPHSVDNKVSFHLYDGHNNYSTTCEAGHPTRYANNLGEIKNGACANSSYSFSLNKQEGGYVFYVTVPGSYGEYGFDKSVDKYRTDHGFDWEYLDITHFEAPAHYA